MFKSLIISMILFCSLGLNQIVMASDLKQAMQELDQGYKAFMRAQNKKQGLEALAQMYKAALISKRNLPSQLKSLEKNDQQIKAYRLTLDMLLVNIEDAKRLIEANKIQEAKKYISKIDATKVQGHGQFKPKF